jgi:5-methylcytosine-specific restriction endonuclease McrA
MSQGELWGHFNCQLKFCPLSLSASCCERVRTSPSLPLRSRQCSHVKQLADCFVGYGAEMSKYMHREVMARPLAGHVVRLPSERSERSPFCLSRAVFPRPCVFMRPSSIGSSGAVFPRPSVFMRPSSEPKAVVLAQRSSLVLHIVPARAVNRRRPFPGTHIAINRYAPSIR